MTIFFGWFVPLLELCVCTVPWWRWSTLGAPLPAAWKPEREEKRREKTSKSQKYRIRLYGTCTEYTFCTHWKCGRVTLLHYSQYTFSCMNKTKTFWCLRRTHRDGCNRQKVIKSSTNDWSREDISYYRTAVSECNQHSQLSCNCLVINVGRRSPAVVVLSDLRRPPTLSAVSYLYLHSGQYT